MPIRSTMLLTAALLTAAPLAVTALPAAAAACTAPEARTQVAPRTVVLGTTGTARVDVVVAVRSNGCTVTAVQARVTSPSKAGTELALTAVGTAGEVTTYTAGLDLAAADLDNADAGSWRVKTATFWAQGGAPVEDEVTTSDDDDDAVEDGNASVEGSGKVDVLAASDLTADATSSQLRKGKITKGKVLTVKGVLTRADWEAAAATGYAKQKVDLQFRTPKGSFKKVRSLQTRSGGAFAEAVKATTDGCYRVVFAGSKTTAAAPSKAECIDVR